ncbi:nicotinamide riboside transporter PnuC [Sphingobacterium psychroaquaticum]|uniref:Nicotinamide riboside transporter PnuC n=1 Tax=Sphingobacterium psychroaquaticum TaxID=561061 RepID=A0A1X7I9B2_9SPHI|nr:nicotinamide riboside transporter PnuC [Sphingobacterium psychroaquaticum]QBQ41802.1 nicotinamide riboside transporter PnuC [Sphingobacterium psychroaquaticum]SMG11189.1 nicotinamide mononucleotide transporter [Sphingobacterium psychroaquaticum]
MQVNDLFEQLYQGLQQTSWLERIAVLFGVTQVLLSKRNKISNYFFGIISILLTISVLYSAKLYAEILLNMYYLVMSVYGLWYWRGQRTAVPVQITRSTPSEWKIVSAIVVVGYFALYLVLRYFTNSDVPMMDAIVSSTAWAGMWLLAKRKLENWILLNISNIIAIPLLFYKGLFLFALLTLVLFIIAIFGYLEWKRIMANQKNTTYV